MPKVLPSIHFSSCRSFLARVGDLDGINILVSGLDAALSGQSRIEGWAYVKELRKTQQGSVIIVAKVVFDRSSCSISSSSNVSSTSGASSLPNTEADGRWFWTLPYEYRALKIDSKELVAAAQIDISLGRHRDNAILDKSLLMLIGGNDNATKAGAKSLTLHACLHDDVFLYYLLDYIEGGDLQSLCAHSVQSAALESSSLLLPPTETKRPFPLRVSETRLRKIFRNVFSTLSFLHEEGFAHRDVSPENILVNADGSGVLIDFGAAVQITRRRKPVDVDCYFSEAVNSASTMCGAEKEKEEEGEEEDNDDTIMEGTLDGWLPQSPPSGSPFCKLSYADPQYVWRMPWYGVAGDLYSCGITMFSAIEGSPLYAAPSALDSRFALLLPRKSSDVGARGEGVSSSEPRLREWMTRRYGGSVSEEYIELVASLVRIPPEERPLSASAVLKHRWFKEE
jgi:serine/threonine protein kinase